MYMLSIKNQIAKEATKKFFKKESKEQGLVLSNRYILLPLNGKRIPVNIKIKMVVN